MQKNVTYYQKNNHIKYVFYKDSTQSYPMHTHTGHMMLGYITGGIVCVVCGSCARRYHAGEYFWIMPDVPHAIEAVEGASYSMIGVCIAFDALPDRSRQEILRLKQLLLETPEKVFPIEDMAKRINVSPYHMIRQFRAVCGLTPHQFQIQCRVRKAQRLLEEGKSVVEAAYETGFYDQSHFDRCFHKIVRLTPNEYKGSVY
ncbi:MAG: AraC family transcriptional regulator [Lachnospiraceae bacterium]|nr:AraC family transcriptional regulator [Lachnospiraceae bacterium]MDE7200867.1 AraC family transcriptional regulator [Lachnospiraceae bacterium]